MEGMRDFDSCTEDKIMHTFVFFTKNHAYRHKRCRPILKIMHTFHFDAGKRSNGSGLADMTETISQFFTTSIWEIS